MSDPQSFILGFDPGGVGHFGWSICEAIGGKLQPHPMTGLANDAWHAICEAKKNLPDNPTVLAAGIDAPLFWSKKGGRKVDEVLRQALKATDFPVSKVGGTVQTVNSLQGACLVQGLLLTRFLSTTGWDLTITESHPRALCHLLCHMGQRDMVQRLTEDVADYTQYSTRCICGCEEADKPKASLADHRRDATLSAISAWAAIYQTPPTWQNLYVEIEEPHRIMPLEIPVSYWMPSHRHPFTNAECLLPGRVA